MKQLSLFFSGVILGALIATLYMSSTHQNSVGTVIPSPHSELTQSSPEKNTSDEQDVSPVSDQQVLADQSKPKDRLESIEQDEKCPPIVSNTIILPPPDFTDEMPEVFITNQEGEARVAWNEVQGAKNYLISVLDQKGKTIKTFKTSRTVIYVKDIPRDPTLKEAQFQVAVAAINLANQEGPLGKPRNLIVKGQAPVRPPEIKTILIE